MKYTILQDLSFDALAAVLPPHRRERARGLVRGDGAFRLLAFPHEKVIVSRQIAKALARLPQDSQELVASAHNFTAEARELLAARGATPVTDGDFHWTDESYAGIRQAKPHYPTA